MDQYIGKLLDNRYEILEIIGTGGMARVYKARCHRLNRLVAIKILREDLAQDAEFRRRFHDESQAVAMLSHPNIVAVYDVSRSSDLEYIVMELIDGITLKQYMQKKGNKLNWREALHFITQIVKALGHAHSRGIIHRDIKPHNIMVLRDGSVKVADFGIARVASGGHSTLTQEALGSVHYISPEQARGSHIDARSDLYSAGVVLYEMITGRLPFEGDTPVSVAIQHINSIPLSPRELDPTIPEALEAITMKAMAPNPDNRYPSADAMLADLEEFRKNPSINFDYDVSEFVPEEPEEGAMTQIRTPHTPVRSRVPEPEPRRRRYEEPEEEADAGEEGGEPEEEELENRPRRRDRRRGGTNWPIIAAIVVILAFVAGLFYFMYQFFISSILMPSPDYTIPKLTGYTYEEVLQDPELRQEFNIVVGQTVESEEAAGTILRQDPAAGSTVKSNNAEITVTVSGGPEVIQMIDVTNQEYLKALATLRDMGLSVEAPEYQFDDEVPANYIISYTPAEGTELKAGDSVHLVVSKGPEASKVTLISFADMAQSDAESRIRLMNLEVGEIEHVSSETVPEGKVVEQWPEAGTEVEEGSKVNLTVSTGPENPDIPQTSTKTLTINLPVVDETDPVQSINVMVTSDDGKEVYNRDVNPLMEVAVSVPVSGTGKVTYNVYFNGRLDHGVTVNFDE